MRLVSQQYCGLPKTAAGPGASEKTGGHLERQEDRLLGSLEALLEAPGALWEASWGLLGRSWGLPGASWAPLGPSWLLFGGLGVLLGILGHLLERLEVTKATCILKINFQTVFSAHRRKFLDLFLMPKSTKIASKTNENLTRISRAKKMLLRSLLELSWTELGVLRPQ